MFRTFAKPWVQRVFGRTEPEPEPTVPPRVVSEPAPRNPLLAAAERLGDKYPDVDTLALSLSIRAPNNELEPTLNGRSFGSDARAYFRFKCKNVDCVEGGFDLSSDVDAMVKDHRTEVSGRLVCQGWESRVLVGQRRCLYELNFKALATYRD
jgi:hypothetical protein